MSRKHEHRIVVTGELRDPPDLQRLSRAIINIAKERTDNDHPLASSAPERPDSSQEPPTPR